MFYKHLINPSKVSNKYFDNILCGENLPLTYNVNSNQATVS